MSRPNQLLDRGTAAPVKPFGIHLLPKQEGFHFVGFRRDGIRIMCLVTADGIDGESLENLVGWRYPATLENLLRD